jgi:hypothetical protein
MEVSANVYFWAPDGMRRGAPPIGCNGYVELREAEKLLEEAHARGLMQGIQSAQRDLSP